jgi:alkaline phosphatase D
MGNLTLYDVENRPWTGPRLRNAAIVGHTTTSTTKIWIRSRLEGLHHFILTSAALTQNDLNFGSREAADIISSLGAKILYKSSHNFRNSTDRTYVFEISKLISGAKLNPGTEYFYYVFSDQVDLDPRIIIGRQDIHSFKTISASREKLSFGLYSCHDPFKKNSDDAPWRHLYNVLNEVNADFLVGGGDQVYVDSTKTDIWKFLKRNKSELLKLSKPELKKTMISYYQDVYRGYWGFSNLRKVQRSIPNYMIWDDHEIMDGWGSRTRNELSDELDTWYEWENKRKNLSLADGMFEAAKTVYIQYQHSHNPTTAKNIFDYSVSQKHGEFYFLDMRGTREYDLERLAKRDGKKSRDRILGKAQLTRFKAWVKAIPITAKIAYVVSPVPVVHWTGFAVNTGDVLGAKDDFRDEWDHETNHLERDKVLNMLFKFSHDKNIPVIFLSGDVHMSAAFKIFNKKYRRAKVFQITSSPITRPPAPKIADIILSNKGYLKTLKKQNDFGYERLARFHTRNFCILQSKVDQNELALDATFYGESKDDDEMRIKKLRLI